MTTLLAHPRLIVGALALVCAGRCRGAGARAAADLGQSDRELGARSSSFSSELQPHQRPRARIPDQKACTLEQPARPRLAPFPSR